MGTVILLTACIAPHGCVNLALSDSRVREQQYAAALDFYLRTAKCPVVFCDNSASDISAPYKDYIERGLLEYLCFDGSDIDGSRGKGYGETKILLYALANSRLLRQSSVVVKITGRVIVENINDIISSWLLRRPDVARFNIAAPDFLRTVIFSYPTAKLLSGLSAHAEDVDESASPPVCFENMMAGMVAEDHTLRLVPFLRSPKIKGVSATSNVQYHPKPDIDNIIDNYTLLSRIFRDSGKPVKAAIIKAALIPMMIFNKFLRRRT